MHDDDDIVTRLRAYTYMDEDGVELVAPLAAEAAAEIVRLRHLLESVNYELARIVVERRQR